MRYLILLVPLAVLMTACGVSGANPNQLPELVPSADPGRAGESEIAPGARAEAENDPSVSRIRCTDVDPHPVGVSIAEKFGVPYDEVMTWFCGGHSFEEILIALQTSTMSDRPVDQLWVMRQTLSWEEIWTDLGIVGP